MCVNCVSAWVSFSKTQRLLSILTSPLSSVLLSPCSSIAQMSLPRSDVSESKSCWKLLNCQRLLQTVTHMSSRGVNGNVYHLLGDWFSLQNWLSPMDEPGTQTCPSKAQYWS